MGTLVGPLVELAESVMFAAGAAVVRTVVLVTGPAVEPFTEPVVGASDVGPDVAGVAVGTSGPTNCCHLTVTFLSMRSWSGSVLVILNSSTRVSNDQTAVLLKYTV